MRHRCCHDHSQTQSDPNHAGPAGNARHVPTSCRGASRPRHRSQRAVCKPSQSTNDAGRGQGDKAAVEATTQDEEPQPPATAEDPASTWLRPSWVSGSGSGPFGLHQPLSSSTHFAAGGQLGEMWITQHRSATISMYRCAALTPIGSIPPVP